MDEDGPRCERSDGANLDPPAMIQFYLMTHLFWHQQRGILNSQAQYRIRHELCKLDIFLREYAVSVLSSFLILIMSFSDKVEFDSIVPQAKDNRQLYKDHSESISSMHLEPDPGKNVLMV